MSEPESPPRSLSIPIQPSLVVALLVGLGFGGGGATAALGSRSGKGPEEARKDEALRADVTTIRETQIKILAVIDGRDKETAALVVEVATLKARVRQLEQLPGHPESLLRLARLEELLKLREGK